MSTGSNQSSLSLHFSDTRKNKSILAFMIYNSRQNSKSAKPTWCGITQCRHPYDNQRNVPFFNKSVGFFLPQLTRKAFENFGFSTASLILDWPMIIGPDLAACTMPEQIKWPPKKPTPSISCTSREDSRPGAALLILRVDPSYLLEATYSSKLIIDRINSYFGYQALAEIRMLSYPLNSSKNANKIPAPTSPHDNEGSQKTLSHHDPLKKALGQLERHLRTSFWREGR